MKIAIAGTGYVGLITGVCLADMGHDVTCIDIQEERIDQLKAGRSPIYETGLEVLLKKGLSNECLTFTTNAKQAYANAEIIFIAVGTPEKQDGTVNLDYIQQVACTIGMNIEKDVIVCTKSTVPVGTNEKIKEMIQSVKLPHLQVDIVSNPEFLREGSAIFDFFNGDRIIIGAENKEASVMIEEIYFPLKIPIIKTNIRSAEMIKYASNTFLATKISFINEIAAICEKVGANVEEVVHGIGKDKRIGPHFLKAGIGYGGSCFPKDTKALVQIADNLDHKFELLEAVIKVNQVQQALAVKKAKETLESLNGVRVALLGLAFKPNTDDVREAASLIIISELLEEGASVIAYDPIATDNAKRVLGSRIEYTNDIKCALLHAELVIIATEWPQIQQLPLTEYSRLMKTPIIIDGRNCYSLQEVQKHPIHYLSIGRPSIINEKLKVNYIR